MRDNFLIAPQQVLIECKINPQGGNTINLNPFDEQDFLIGRPIIAIQAFSASDMPFSPLASNLPVIPDALFPFAFLNINRAGEGPIQAGVWYKWKPLCSMRHVWNNTIALPSNLDLFRCDPMTIQWRDTNVAFPVSQGQAAVYSVPFLVTYLLPNQDPTPYRRAFLKGQVPNHIHGVDEWQ